MSTRKHQIQLHKQNLVGSPLNMKYDQIVTICLSSGMQNTELWRVIVTNTSYIRLEMFEQIWISLDTMFYFFKHFENHEKSRILQVFLADETHMAT